MIGLTAVAGVQLGVLTAKSLPEATLRRLFAVLVLARGSATRVARAPFTLRW